ncbi:MAG: nicotinate-nucleotide adenylyltransferase [Dehalococcoidales bacterium]|nr:nicotinate-nucleotide adenylyltransferase [Dehalococcoidales bacterium]
MVGLKTGILGGTFDPVHIGHLKVAEEVKKRLGLQNVIFVPAGQPWMKSNKTITPVEQRVEMVRLAIAGHPDFELSLSEVNRPGSTYTVQTIREFRRKFGEGAEIYFIIGRDGLWRLPQWRSVGQLIKLCRIAVVPRPGFSLPDMDAMEKQVPGLSGSVVLLDKPEIDVSATEIRRRVAQGVPWKTMVPAPVAEYIKEHGLYVR